MTTETITGNQKNPKRDWKKKKFDLKEALVVNIVLGNAHDEWKQNMDSVKNMC